MDKNTLSNYGWIVIAVLVLSVMIALATPFGGYIKNAVWSTTEGLFETEDAALGKVLDDMGIVPSVDELQAKHKFDYYSTFRGAVADANANTIGENADCDKADATAGIYTENGETFVVLLKDTTETNRVTVSADMTINLGGNVLTFDNAIVGIDTVADNGNTITIDGRLEGSKIYSFGQGNNARCGQSRAGNTLNVNGGEYVATSDSGAVYGFSTSRGIITDCIITVTSNTGKGTGIQFGSSATGTIKNCTISAFSSSNVTSQSSIGVGINPNSNVDIKNCNIIGIHSAINSLGNLTIDGGTYEGYGHGGLYIGGNDTTSYIKNATIKQCDKPTDFDVGITSNLAGFYIGGGDSNSNRNTVVYMDNCTIYGSCNSFVLKVGSGYKNLSLYISNSNINTKAKIRLDSDSIYTNALYIGKGNNFTAEHTTRPTAVVTTDEIYCQ